MTEDHVARFTELRPLLFSIAYRLLGSVGDAEDVLQDAFLRWDGADRSKVDSPKAYLSSIVTRLCIDQLRSARVRREAYVGPWLPEPLLDEMSPDVAETAELSDSLSLAFLVLLENLSPVERAVFVLREVFAFEYAEIARIVGKSEANCRQIAHRARSYIAERRPRHEVSKQQKEEVTRRFIAACAGGDLNSLVDLFTEDITLWSDGGDKARAARRPIYGKEKVARFLLGIIRKGPPETSVQVARVNGQPGLLLSLEDEPYCVVGLDISGHAIQGLQIIVNPDKLPSPSGPNPEAPPH